MQFCAIIRPVKLFGREAALRSVLDSQDPVVMISGDSGTGKSALLEAARQAEAELPESERPISMVGIPVTFALGSLQRALLEALSNVTALIVTDQSRARTVVQNLTVAAKRLTKVRGSDVAKVVAKVALELVRDRAGDMIADAIQTVGQELTTSSFEAISAQITTATDPGVVGLIASLLEALLALTDGHGIVLSLEDCEKLAPDELRVLADLRTQLPPVTKLRFTYSVHGPISRPGYELLLSAGLVDVPLKGLREEEVKEWIVAEGLTDTLANEIHIATGGFPALVQEAIALKRDGGSLAGLRGPELTRRLVPSIWGALDTSTKSAGILVSPWERPVPDTPSYVGLEPLTWAAAEDALWYSRLFSAEVGGRRWFHALRRQVLWDEVLTASERELALRRYRDYMATELQLDDSRIDYLIELARLTTTTTGPIAAELGPQMQAVSATDPASLAVLAAAVELSDPRSSTPGVGIEYLVAHARQAFGGAGDLFEAAGRLHEGGLLSAYALAPDHVSFGPSIVEPDAQLLLRGRSADELGRIPIPGIATAVFDSAMRPHVEPFAWGHYGVGHPRAALLSNMVRRRPIRPGEPIHVTVNPPPGLLLRARFGGSDLYAAFSYDDANARDSALRSVEGFTAEIVGRHLEIVNAFTYPAPRVPSKLLAEGSRIASTSRERAERVPPNSDAWMVRHGATFTAIRNLLSPHERMAADLEEPVGIVYGFREDASQYAYVQGREGVERIALEQPALGIGLQMLRFAETLGLEQGERIGQQVSRLGGFGSDPVKEAVDFVTGRMSEFNASQERLIIVLDERDLERRLAEAATRAWSLAAALAEAEGSTLPARPPRATFIVVQDPETPGFVPAGNASAHVLRLQDAGEAGSFRVAFVRSEDPVPHDDTPRLFEELFGVSAEGRLIGGGPATILLADLLGYESADVAFTYPES